MAKDGGLDRNLSLEAVRVTEAAAVASVAWMGRGDEKAADQAAVDAMRTALNRLDIAGTVVIGEGECDEAPMLYIGEPVGTGDGPEVDIALDPLEGTTITATGGANALAAKFRGDVHAGQPGRQFRVGVHVVGDEAGRAQRGGARAGDEGSGNGFGAAVVLQPVNAPFERVARIEVGPLGQAPAGQGRDQLRAVGEIIDKHGSIPR